MPAELCGELLSGAELGEHPKPLPAEDRAEAQLRAGLYGRLSETYDAAQPVPAQLERG
jgi:hypothetical protein